MCACRHMVDKRDDPRIEFCPLHAHVERTKRERDALLEAAKDALERAQRIGPGADWDADPDDPSPDDAISHDIGLLCQMLKHAIAACGEWDR